MERLRALVEAPKLVSWDRLLTLLGLWVAIMLGVLNLGFVWWIGWPLLVLVPTVAVSVKWRSPDLRIVYSPTEHWKLVGDRLTVGLSVKNITGRTIHNVSLKVEELRGPDGAKLDEFSGKRLAVAGTGNPPHAPPDSSTTLHRGDDVTFAVVRVAKEPANHIFEIANYVPTRFGSPSGWSNQVTTYQQSPRGVLPPGRYSLRVMAQGDNAKGDAGVFEFWGTSERSVFVRP